MNRKRFYETPEGNKYPSITTVLSTRKKEGLWEWRKRVGNDVANYVARTSAARGTAVHHMCEDYLNNYPIDVRSNLFRLDPIKGFKKYDLNTLEGYLSFNGYRN